MVTEHIHGQAVGFSRDILKMGVIVNVSDAAASDSAGNTDGTTP